MIESHRYGMLSALNSRYIYGKMPLLHSLVFILQLALVMVLTRRFNSYYAARPVLTTMVTNAILGGIADTVAQTMTAVRQRRKSGDPQSIEFDDLEKKGVSATVDHLPDLDPRRLPPPFDFERLTRFMAYGFLIAPIQHRWFSFLSAAFPLTKDAATTQALKRVAMDQLIMAPIGLALFFLFMTVAEGGGRRAITRKFQEVFIPSLKANYMVWPAVQIVNFRIVPLQFQIPLVSTIGIAWTAYLSLTNSSDES